MRRQLTGPSRQRLLTMVKGVKVWVQEAHPYPPGVYKPNTTGLSWSRRRFVVLDLNKAPKHPR